jgi:hypothetical protein
LNLDQSGFIKYRLNQMNRNPFGSVTFGSPAASTPKAQPLPPKAAAPSNSLNPFKQVSQIGNNVASGIAYGIADQISGKGKAPKPPPPTAEAPYGWVPAPGPPRGY